MKIKYFGHSAFSFDDLLIDPFIRENPLCKIKVGDIKCKLLKCKTAIPMHYNTWDIIKVDPREFKKKAPCDVVILKSGEVFEV